MSCLQKLWVKHNSIKVKQTNTVKPVLSGHSKRTPKLIFNTNYCLMQVKSIAECSKGIQGEHSAILLTFIKLPFSIKTFVLSILSGCLRQVLQSQYFHNSIFGLNIYNVLVSHLLVMINTSTNPSINPLF